ncbi:hypothetical protein RJ55_07682 [Drechmeria coniospora]|nr:hypothetical protein RJ55_07682 [Drechmeria coniospora]
MARGQWPEVNGQRSMARGQWPEVNGQRSMARGQTAYRLPLGRAGGTMGIQRQSPRRFSCNSPGKATTAFQRGVRTRLRSMDACSIPPRTSTALRGSSVEWSRPSCCPSRHADREAALPAFLVAPPCTWVRACSVCDGARRAAQVTRRSDETLLCHGLGASARRTGSLSGPSDDNRSRLSVLSNGQANCEESPFGWSAEDDSPTGRTRGAVRERRHIPDAPRKGAADSSRVPFSYQEDWGNYTFTLHSYLEAQDEDIRGHGALRRTFLRPASSRPHPSLAARAATGLEGTGHGDRGRIKGPHSQQRGEAHLLVEEDSLRNRHGAAAVGWRQSTVRIPVPPFAVKRCCAFVFISDGFFVSFTALGFSPADTGRASKTQGEFLGDACLEQTRQRIYVIPKLRHISAGRRAASNPGPRWIKEQQAAEASRRVRARTYLREESRYAFFHAHAHLRRVGARSTWIEGPRWQIKTDSTRRGHGDKGGAVIDVHAGSMVA